MPVDLWSSQEFVRDATAWVGEAVAADGLRLTGEWEQPHCRPWSSAIRFETSGGRLWFKVNGPGTAHEAALIATLGRLVPDLVPDVIAVDEVRAWTLMRDAGPVMRTIADPDQLWDHWEQVLPWYAEAQLTLSRHVDELLLDGVPAATPKNLPGLAESLLDELSRLPADEGGLIAEEATRMRAVMPTFAGWAAELAASGIPDTLNHDDLHSSNICWRDPGPRIIDWGDAVVGHPLGTMLGTLNSIAWHAKTEHDDPRVVRLRDAYLEPFTEYADRDALVSYVELARRTGCVSKALSYVRAFEGEPMSAQAEEDWPVRGWFLEILEYA